jgi:hypothetical membrane protein
MEDLNTTSEPPARALPMHRRRRTGVLLLSGALAGPLYVGLSLIEVLCTPGFSPMRHAWSQLALAPSGWVHTANLIVSGLLVVAYGFGLRALRRPTRGAPVLMMMFGLSMVVAGIFRVDPGNGFPPGSPETSAVSTSGLVHFGAGAVGFLAVGICLPLLARHLSATRHRVAMVANTVVGPVFVVAFALMASGLLGIPAGLTVFTVAVILLFTTLSITASLIRADEVGKTSPTNSGASRPE